MNPIEYILTEACYYVHAHRGNRTPTLNLLPPYFHLQHLQNRRNCLRQQLITAQSFIHLLPAGLTQSTLQRLLNFILWLKLRANLNMQLTVHSNIPELICL